METVADKWYEQVPGKVRGSEKDKILWGFSIQTDHHLEHNGSDLVVVGKQQAVCQIIKIAVPGDAGVGLKEKVRDKSPKAREWRKLNLKRQTRVVLIVAEAIGTISKGVVGHLESIGLCCYVLGR